jgi:hypothetical protein
VIDDDVINQEIHENDKKVYKQQSLKSVRGQTKKTLHPATELKDDLNRTKSFEEDNPSA